MRQVPTGETTVSAAGPEVSVIIPARNEEACLGRCLETLILQWGNFELLVVDDGSTDRTREIASSYQVQVSDARPLPPGWSGKSNALWTGAQRARGQWLLFTDADTAHKPGSLQAALEEARANQADLLSYSPEQEVHSFAERAVMPLIFAELASTYRPAEVSDPSSTAAAANGQYILITREAYNAVGGHAAIAGSLLEDVELAKRVKQSGRRLHFRFGGDAVTTRMYRSFAQLREGWSKNLALLFPSPGRLALLRSLEFVAGVGGFGVALASLLLGKNVLAAIAAGIAIPTLANLFFRVRKAHFGLINEALAPLGLPLFVYLLARSALLHQQGKVMWKGRQYGAPAQEPASPAPRDIPAPAGTGKE